MKKGFLKENKIFGINLLYVISLLPLIGYSFYKNGIVMVQNGYMSVFKSLQYLVIPIVIIVLSYVFEIYYYLGIKKDKDNHNVLNTIVPYLNTLCYLVCGPMDYLYITVPLIVILDVGLKFLENKIKINQVALFEIILVGFLSLLSLYNNANLYERSIDITLDVSDYFIGKGIGGIGTTSVLLSLVGFIILLFNRYYKKDIPIACFIGYALVGLIIYFVGGISFNTLLINTFSSGFVFATVFVASVSTATPVVRSGRILYGLLVGVLSAVFVNALKFNLGIYIVILVLGLLCKLFNKFRINAN